MGKKKRGAQPEEPAQPGMMDRIMANRALAIGAGALVVAAFAGLGILAVTLLGGDDLGADNGPKVPEPIGPPPAVARSAAADLLETKTWDEMTADERGLVESETVRAFDDSTFRAANGLVLGIDVFRREGATLVSRQYKQVAAAGGDEVAEQIMFYCDGPEGSVQPYRYIVTSSQRDFLEGSLDQFQPAFGPIMAGAVWSEAVDLGWRDSDLQGRRMHGFELEYKLNPEAEGPGSRVQYWFDVETAQLLERGEVFPGDDASTDANWYRLRYDELPPIVIPEELEQPPCVEETLATIYG